MEDGKLKMDEDLIRWFDKGIKGCIEWRNGE
jgi:hypothetical protein